MQNILLTAKGVLKLGNKYAIGYKAVTIANNFQRTSAWHVHGALDHLLQA